MILGPLVDQYGPERVWIAGLRVLGFPPTLNPSAADAVKIGKFLADNTSSKG